MNLEFVSVVRPSLFFGAYPSQAQIEQLEQNGVRAFINLTCTDELLEPYTTNYFTMRIAIEDNNVPADIPLFCQQISEVLKVLKSNTPTYVHCRGGHGRSGMVSAILVAMLDHLSADDAITVVSEAHRQRANIREFWKKRPCPHLHVQRKFIHRLFSPMYWVAGSPFAMMKGYCTSSPHEVTIGDITYANCDEALASLSPKVSADTNRVYHMLLEKYLQHPELLKTLLWTGFRRFHCKCQMGSAMCAHQPISEALYAVKMRLLDL